MLTDVLGNDRLMETARQLDAAGEPFAVATVVYRKPPVSSQVGDKAIITADGRLIGWIGGSCSQPLVRREAAEALRTGRPRLLRLTTDPVLDATPTDQLSTVPMTCPSGGEVEIYIEPHVQRPHIMAVGNTPLVRALGRLAPVVGFAVTLVAEDPAELAEPDTTARRMALAEWKGATLGANAFVVVATAGHYDEEALQAALRSPAPYIALVASRRRAAATFEVLQASGCTAEQLARVRTPAGLDIGAATQEEIALSILAEVVAEYRRRQRAEAAEPEPLPMAAPQTAVDPVCGMEVEIAGARHTAEHDGQMYYFCCPHCRHHFLKHPAKYLGAQS
jgi:xanthine dehydrogenase accessory factor